MQDARRVPSTSHWHYEESIFHRNIKLFLHTVSQNEVAGWASFVAKQKQSYAGMPLHIFAVSCPSPFALRRIRYGYRKRPEHNAIIQ